METEKLKHIQAVEVTRCLRAPSHGARGLTRHGVRMCFRDFVACTRAWLRGLEPGVTDATRELDVSMRVGRSVTEAEDSRPVLVAAPNPSQDTASVIMRASTVPSAVLSRKRIECH